MLADVPMVFILVGIAAYTVLSGADFGAGMWTLAPGGGQASAAATRDHTRHAIGPVFSGSASRAACTAISKTTYRL